MSRRRRPGCAAPPGRPRGARRRRRAGRRRPGCAGTRRTARKPSGPSRGTSLRAVRVPERAVARPGAARCCSARPSPMPDTRRSSGAEAVLTSTPTALTQSSTTASRDRDSFGSDTSCWYWPTPIDLGSILTSSASGSCRRRAIDTAPRSDTSRPGSSCRGVGGGRVHRRAGLGHDDLGQPEVGVAALISSAASLSVSREAVPLPMATSSTPVLRASRASAVDRLVPLRGGARGGRSCRWPPPCRWRRRRPPSRRSAAGVEAHGGPGAGRGGQQQVPEVGGEDPDGLVLGLLRAAGCGRRSRGGRRSASSTPTARSPTASRRPAGPVRRRRSGRRCGPRSHSGDAP